MTSTKLASLEITEISGVDSGAHMLDGWLVCKSRDGSIPILRKAMKPDTDDELYEFVVQGFGKANPNQRRGDDGKYRRHVPGLTDQTSPAAAEAHEEPPAPAAKGLRFFRPVTDAYRRLW